MYMPSRHHHGNLISRQLNSKMQWARVTSDFLFKMGMSITREGNVSTKCEVCKILNGKKTDGHAYRPKLLSSNFIIILNFMI